MALKKNELFSKVDRSAALRCFPTVVKPKKFAADVGEAKLAPLTMVAYDTSTNNWKPWTDGGSDGTGTLKGLVWPDAIQLDATDEVLGHVMIEGRVHRDDVPLNGESQVDVDAELASAARLLGIHVEGLAGVR